MKRLIISGNKKFQSLELKSKFQTSKKVEVDYSTFLENIEKGLQTIWFVESINRTFSEAVWLQDKGINAVAFNSSLLPSERLELQLKFAKKKVQVIVCTNVLVQGVDFECENLMVSSDLYNTSELMEQKIGSLGRLFLSNKNKVFYCLEDERRQIVKSKVNLYKDNVDKSHLEDKLAYLEDAF